jgi:hypothetical protein
MMFKNVGSSAVGLLMRNMPRFGTVQLMISQFFQHLGMYEGCPDLSGGVTTEHGHSAKQEVLVYFSSASLGRADSCLLQ